MPTALSTPPGATEWEVYLPAGEWIDAFTGSRHGAGLLRRPTPIDELPVYVRADAWDRMRAVFAP